MILFGYEFIIRKVGTYVPVSNKSAGGYSETNFVQVPTIKKPKKKRHKKCFYKDKVMYTREEAADAMKHIKNPQIRIYCCEFCQNYHLTHKKRHKY